MKKGIEISSVNGRKIVKGIGYYEPADVKSIRDVVKKSVISYGDMTGFKYKDKNRNIVEKTYKQLDFDVDRLGTALISLGLKDTNIAIIGENRYDWCVSYLSVVNGTGVVVPLDKHLPSNEVKSLITRGKVSAIFYSSSYQEMMEEISKEDDSVKYFICMDDTEGKNEKFTSMPKLIKKGDLMLNKNDTSFTKALIDPEKMSILLFTSGTTSMAKGVMLSHKNVVSNIRSITSTINLYPGEVHLSLLPLHHTFENTIGMLLMIHRGVCIAYCDGIKYVAKNLNEYKVTLLVAVPAIFDVMYRKVQDGIIKSGKEKLVNTLIKTSEFLRSIGIDLRKKLFKSITKQFAPYLRLAVSGAAPLDPNVTLWFDKLGITLLEGYGLTETSPVVAANNDNANKPGTVGQPIADVTVAIDSPDESGMGEILVKGDSIMLGYYENPEANAEVFTDDGYFRTGDLGVIDDKGYIKITGRAKSMIVLSNGKKAFPEEYEVMLNNIPGVKDSFVWGFTDTDGSVDICAEIVLDKEHFGDKYLSEEDFADMFDAEIKKINKAIPQYKIIKYFVMTYDELIKTTTLKIKRPLELDKITNILKNAKVDMRKASGKLTRNI